MGALLDLVSSSNEPGTNNTSDGWDDREIATVTLYNYLQTLSVYRQPQVEMETLKDLVARGADIDASYFCGKRALHWAIDINSVEVVEFLRDNGAEFRYVAQAGGNLLEEVAKRIDYPRTNNLDNIEKLVDILVDEGVEVNAPNSRGHKPLHVASAEENWTVARGLIFHSAEIDVDIKGDGRQFCEGCLREIGMLKDTNIDARTSLYRMMHMRVNDRHIYVDNENLKRIVDSPDLKVQFPEYAGRILTSYVKAQVRHSLVKYAKEVWLGFTDFNLPEECVERIFVYLSDMDLEAIVDC